VVGRQRNPRKPRDPQERFWEKVDKSGPCWLWTGYLQPLGYARFRVGEKMIAVHRFAYETLVGPVPPGLDLDHLCRVRNGVNPAHLEPVTERENVLRGGMPNGALAKRTHCGRGHLFDEANTYFRPDGGRRCRKCTIVQVQRSARRYQAERAGAGLEIDQTEDGWDVAKLRHELRLLRAENARLREALGLPPP